VHVSNYFKIKKKKKKTWKHGFLACYVYHISEEFLWFLFCSNIYILCPTFNWNVFRSF